MAAHREVSPLPRSPSVRLTDLPPAPPPFPAGAPPDYTHRDLTLAADRQHHVPMDRFQLRGRSMPPSQMEGGNRYPPLAASGYAAPTYHPGSFAPGQFGIPYGYGYEIPPPAQSDRGRAQALQDPGSVRPSYQTGVGSRGDATEQDRARLRHERERAHARERRLSWLPRD